LVDHTEFGVVFELKIDEVLFGDAASFEARIELLQA
jgi:hypothetical protein